MTQKIAIVTGVTGQDGAYLAEFLINKNYKVIGTYRRTSSINFWRMHELLPIRNVVGLVNILNVNTLPVAVFTEPQAAGLKSVALYLNWYNFLFKTEIATVRND